MTLSDEQKIFTVNVSKLIAEIHGRGYFCSFGEAWRTPEQAKLNAKKGTGIVSSLHCDRLAIDLNIFNPEGKLLADVASLKQFGDFWKGRNPLNRWGGDFKGKTAGDVCHFSMGYGGRA